MYIYICIVCIDVFTYICKVNMYGGMTIPFYGNISQLMTMALLYVSGERIFRI